MKTTIYLNQFRDGFLNMGRGNSYTYEGYYALFSLLSEEEESTGEEMEFDPVAFCGQYDEYESIEDFNEAMESKYESWTDAIEQTGMFAAIFNNGQSAIVDNTSY